MYVLYISLFIQYTVSFYVSSNFLCEYNPHFQPIWSLCHMTILITLQLLSYPTLPEDQIN